MIAVIDYDAGNMKSVEKALDFLNAEYVVTKDAAVLRTADKLILPGVGAFGDAMEKLNAFGLTEEIKSLVSSGKPILGICLGIPADLRNFQSVFRRKLKNLSGQ